MTCCAGANGVVNELAGRGRGCQWADQSSDWQTCSQFPLKSVVAVRQSDANLFSITASCSTLAAAAAAAGVDDVALLVTTS